LQVEDITNLCFDKVLIPQPTPKLLANNSDIMTIENAKKALSGEWVYIGAFQFKITEDMDMVFKGESCAVVDTQGVEISRYDQDSGKISTVVISGTRCDVMKAYISFQKR